MNPTRKNQIEKNARFLGIGEEEYEKTFEYKQEINAGRYEFEYVQACLELRKNIEKLSAQLALITPQKIFEGSLPDIDTTINCIRFYENKISILKNIAQV